MMMMMMMMMIMMMMMMMMMMINLSNSPKICRNEKVASDCFSSRCFIPFFYLKRKVSQHGQTKCQTFHEVFSMFVRWFCFSAKVHSVWLFRDSVHRQVLTEVCWLGIYIWVACF